MNEASAERETMDQHRAREESRRTRARLTVHHRQRQVVDDLPVRESLFDGSFLSRGVVVVLDEVSNEPLVLGLLLKEDSETERVEEPPSEGVKEVRDEERSTGEGGKEHGTESVGEEEYEREVG